MKYRIDHGKCTFCGCCAGVCKAKALWIYPEKGHGFNIDEQKCTGCRVCYMICPFEAIAPVPDS